MKIILLLLLFLPFITFSQENDKKKALEIHNKARKLVGVAPLVWSEKLEKQALNYARFLARNNKFKHSKTTSGENLYKESSWEWSSRKNITYTYSDYPLYDASLALYEEKKDYKYSKIRKFRFSTKMIGHYTQMVWEGTKEVGIASVKNNGVVYVVARYYPAGNWIGKYPYKSR